MIDHKLVNPYAMESNSRCIRNRESAEFLKVFWLKNNKMSTWFLGICSQAGKNNNPIIFPGVSCQ